MEDDNVDLQMIKSKKDKIIAVIFGLLMLILYFASLSLNSIQSYERDALTGVEWLLDSAALYYLPLFPFASGICIVGCRNGKTALQLGITNCILTLIFMIFAYAACVLQYTWLCLFIASLIFVGMAVYDEKQNSR